MKFQINKAILFTLLFSILMAPQYVKANSPDEETLKLIELLKARIELLLSQRISPSVTHSSVSNIKGFEKFASTTYDGEYKAVYSVEDGQSLKLVHGSTEYDKVSEQILSEMLRVLGQEMIIEMIDEVRLYEDETQPESAFVHQLRNQNWALGINLSRTDFNHPDFQKDFEYTLVHEYGHIVTESNQTKERWFIKRFWRNDRDVENMREARDFLADDDLKNFWATLESYTDKYDNQFVTPYAASSPYEDLAETFTYTVYNKKGRIHASSLRSQKIKWIFIEEDYANARNLIRKNIGLEADY